VEAAAWGGKRGSAKEKNRRIHSTIRVSRKRKTGGPHTEGAELSAKIKKISVSELSQNRGTLTITRERPPEFLERRESLRVLLDSVPVWALTNLGKDQKGEGCHFIRKENHFLGFTKFPKFAKS